MVSAVLEVPAIQLHATGKDVLKKPQGIKTYMFFYAILHGTDAIMVVLKIPRHLTLDTMQNWIMVQEDFY